MHAPPIYTTQPHHGSACCMHCVWGASEGIGSSQGKEIYVPLPLGRHLMVYGSPQIYACAIVGMRRVRRQHGLNFKGWHLASTFAAEICPLWTYAHLLPSPPFPAISLRPAQLPWTTATCVLPLSTTSSRWATCSSKPAFHAAIKQVVHCNPQDWVAVSFPPRMFSLSAQFCTTLILLHYSLFPSKFPEDCKLIIPKLRIKKISSADDITPSEDLILEH